jgi:hypothetical protein
MQENTLIELWPKIRTFTCCKCSKSFESEAANAFMAIQPRSGDGWAHGVDVEGKSVIFCPTCAMPRVDWQQEIIFTRPDLALKQVSATHVSHSVKSVTTSSDFVLYEVHVNAPGFHFLVSDRPIIYENVSTQHFITLFEDRDYAEQLGLAAIAVFLATKDEWKKASLEARIKHLERENERLLKMLAGGLL